MEIISSALGGLIGGWLLTLIGSRMFHVWIAAPFVFAAMVFGMVTEGEIVIGLGGAIGSVVAAAQHLSRRKAVTRETPDYGEHAESKSNLLMGAAAVYSGYQVGRGARKNDRRRDYLLQQVRTYTNLLSGDPRYVNARSRAEWEAKLRQAEAELSSL